MQEGIGWFDIYVVSVFFLLDHLDILVELLLPCQELLQGGAVPLPATHAVDAVERWRRKAAERAQEAV
jgi:hypothetical protein